MERGQFNPPVDGNQGLTDHLALVSLIHQPDNEVDVQIATHGEERWPAEFWIAITDFALGKVAEEIGMGERP